MKKKAVTKRKPPVKKAWHKTVTMPAAAELLKANPPNPTAKEEMQKHLVDAIASLFAAHDAYKRSRPVTTSTSSWFTLG